tara:strand:+ start:522 stop:686 length:165 start_codon:yes stop_codon:yes gene_type:complete
MAFVIVSPDVSLLAVPAAAKLPVILREGPALMGTGRCFRPIKSVVDEKKPFRVV